MTDPAPRPSLADDRRWMRVALAEARRAEGRTAPNPPVGCAIVSAGGQLLASGHTAVGGRPHAETEALEMAGEAAQGATAYVTLSHARIRVRQDPVAMPSSPPTSRAL